MLVHVHVDQVGHMGQVQLWHVQGRQGDALKAAREKGIAGKGWQSSAKSHMLGCLDIDFCEWDSADIARQWRRLMRREAGGRLPPGIAQSALLSLIPK